MNEPRHAYVGIAPDGSLQLVLSSEILPPVGKRLDYDESVPVSRKVIVSAIRGAEAFMDGEEYQEHVLTFGQPTDKK